MKAFLYAGAALMASAVVYGLVDYKTSSHNKEFRNLYKTEEQANTKTNHFEAPREIVTEKTKEETSHEAYAKNSASIDVGKKNTAGNKNVVNTVDPGRAASINMTSSKSFLSKKKKVLTYRLFSRAALDEKYLEKALPVDSATKNINHIEKH